MEGYDLVLLYCIVANEATAYRRLYLWRYHCLASIYSLYYHMLIPHVLGMRLCGCRVLESAPKRNP